MAFKNIFYIFIILIIYKGCLNKEINNEIISTENDSKLLCKPHEIHMGLTNNSTQMRVTWRTNSHDCSNEVLLLTLEEDALLLCDVIDDINNEDCKIQTKQNINGYSYETDQDLFCGPEASTSEFLGYYHTVILMNLVPGEYYYYKLPNSDEIYQFKSALSKGDIRDFTFYGFGDMGESIDPEAKSAGADYFMQSILNEGHPELILHVGDISYADGLHFIWDNFMVLIEKMASNVPWMIVNGNHEYGVSGDVKIDPWGKIPYMPQWGFYDDNDSGGECGLHIHWKFPFDKFSDDSLKIGKQRNGYLLSPENGKAFPPFYYSFDYGTVHFVSLSSEHSLEDNSEQKIWLENDLSNVDRCTTPFVIVLLHRPLYAPTADHENYITALNLLKIYEPILINYNVDFVLSGHVHAYYFVNAINNQKCVIHNETLNHIHLKNDYYHFNFEDHYCLRNLVIGTAGHEFDPFKPEDIEIAEKIITYKWGFGKFEVKGINEIKMTFVTTKNNDVEDEVIFKNQGLCNRHQKFNI